MLKKDIAAHMGVDPSYLSQLLSRSIPIERLEQIAKAADVPPHYFDEYVAKASCALLTGDLRLLNLVRTYFFEMADADKAQFIEEWKTRKST